MSQVLTLNQVDDGIKKIKCTHKIFLQDAINVSKLPEDSIDLVITSPPYWSIKDYGNTNQLGYNDSLNEYMTKLTQIFTNPRSLNKLIILC